MGYIPGFDPFKTVHDLSKLATEYLTTALGERSRHGSLDCLPMD